VNREIPDMGGRRRVEMNLESTDKVVSWVAIVISVGRTMRTSGSAR
jgi:hypothetical protein